MPDAATWKRLSIYQVLTDRFARHGDEVDKARLSNRGSAKQPSLRRYNGGTWRGIVERLDYIQGMGFDAVWISPIVENIDETTHWGDAYHGYWPLSFHSLNHHFGTAADLLALSDALHERGMYLMVDVVVNHMGPSPSSPSSSSTISTPSSTSPLSTSTIAPISKNGPPPPPPPQPKVNVNFQAYTPFSSPTYFHPPNFIRNYNDQTQCEHGWLGDAKVPLPDLDTENALVASTLHSWIAHLVQTFHIDGLRLDTVKHVPQPFWPGFVSAAGVWSVGEVLSGDPDYLSSYQPYVGGLLDYGTYYPLKRAFDRQNGNMRELTATLTKEYRAKFTDTQQLATFMENHDMPRFAADTNSDPAVVCAALTYMFLGADGLPIVYYGQERGFSGDGDPGSRECFWLSSPASSPATSSSSSSSSSSGSHGQKQSEQPYDTSTTMYKFIALLNQIRKLAWDAGFGMNLSSVLGADQFLAILQRGPVLLLLTNLGSRAADAAPESMPPLLSGGVKYPTGTVLVNILTKQSVLVARHGVVNFPSPYEGNGMPGIYLPLPLAQQVLGADVQIEIPSPLKEGNWLHRFWDFVSSSSSSAEKNERKKTSWNSGIAALGEKTPALAKVKHVLHENGGEERKTLWPSTPQEIEKERKKGRGEEWSIFWKAPSGDGAAMI